MEIKFAGRMDGSQEGLTHIGWTLCTPDSAFGPLGEGHVRFALVRPVSVMDEIVSAVRAGDILGGAL